MDSNSEELAIDIRNALFQYKTGATVLENLCLQVPKGKIFCLLGPNGTGETTLIRLILGSLQLKSGSIRVFDARPGSQYSDIPGIGVGYMPQDLALIEEFTIKEMFNFYGAIYQIKKPDLKKRRKDLMTMLNLPEKGRLINKLSGGQKRRLSLAISLLHTPKLIVLDEPTAGVDPLLRKKIWQYLEEICINKDKTVLITTHYIEEAKSAANIAYMNYGTVLKQSDPQKLLQQYRCPTLEAVFLIICLQNKDSAKSIENDMIDVKQDISKEKEEVLEVICTTNKTPDKCFDKSRVKALIWKYYILSVRNPIFLFAFFLLPILSLITNRLAFGQNPKHIPIVINNRDQNNKYSQQFIESIDSESVSVKFSDDNETAYQSVVNGNNYMSLVFGQNFSENFEYRLIDYLKLSDEELENSKIQLYVDNTDPIIGNILISYLLEALIKLIKKVSTDLNINAEQYYKFISPETPMYGQIEFDVDNAFFPGFILSLCQCLPMIIVSLQIVYERKNSSLERILVSGVKPLEIFFAHLIENFVLIGTQVFFILIFAFFVLNYKQTGNYSEVYLLLLLNGIQGMFFGLLIGFLVNGEGAVFAVIFALNCPIWFTSGVFWSILAIPKSLQFFIKLSPLTLPLEALRSIMSKGWTISHPIVYIGFITNIVYIVILLIIDLFLFLNLKY